MLNYEDISLTDGEVVLRAWRAQDATALFEAVQDPEIARWTPEARVSSITEAELAIEQAMVSWRLDRSGTAMLAITEASSGRLLGGIGRWPSRRTASEFFYWLAPQARGRGVATAALRLIADWTFATTGVLRVEVCVEIANESSGAVAARAGFTREGVRRGWITSPDGQSIDVICYVFERELPTPRPSAA